MSTGILHLWWICCHSLFRINPSDKGLELWYQGPRPDQDPAINNEVTPLFCSVKSSKTKIINKLKMTVGENVFVQFIWADCKAHRGFDIVILADINKNDLIWFDFDFVTT